MVALSAAQQGLVQGQAGAKVALDDEGLLLEVVVVGGFQADLAGDGQEGADVGFHALQVNAAVAGQADDHQLALTGGQGDGEDNVLERVSASPGAAVGLGARGEHIGGCHQRVDGGGVRSVQDLGGGGVAEVDVGGHHGGDGLDVGCVAAGGAHEGVLADLGGVQEFLALGAAHGAGGGRDRNDLQAQPLEDADVGCAVRRVAGVQAGVVNVEGVGVLHDELAAAQQAGPGARFIAVLVLDLVEAQRQVLVRGVQVLDQEGEHFLVRGGQQVVGTLAVLEPEQAFAIFGPAVGGLVGFPRQQGREVHFLGADRRHFLADDGFNLAQHAEPQRQPGVDAGRRAPDVAGPDEEPVAGHLGVDGIFTQGAQEKLGQSCDHGRVSVSGEWLLESRAGQFFWVLIYRQSTPRSAASPGGEVRQPREPAERPGRNRATPGNAKPLAVNGWSLHSGVALRPLTLRYW